MTFQEMFDRAKTALTKASAADPTAFVAVQVNVTGDGSGIFYVKAADGVLAVEPYDYLDRDVMLTADSEALLTALETAQTEALELEGDAEKVAAFRTILGTLPAPAKKPARRGGRRKAAETKEAPAAAKSEPAAAPAEEPVKKAAAKSTEVTAAAAPAEKPAATTTRRPRSTTTRKK